MPSDPATPADDRPARGDRLRAVLRSGLFVVLGAAVVTVGSERMFWYWSTDPLAHVELSLFYAGAIAFSLWAVERYRVDDAWSFLLTVPLFAYWVEGVITPVVYSGGPFVPVFPVWFTAWHGLLSLTVLWYFFRRWLVAGRWRPLLAASLGVGLFWGAWSITLTLPENVNDPELIVEQGGPLEILGPLAFARYAVVFTLILAGAHYLLGRVWVSSYRPARLSRWLWLAATAIMVGTWTVAYPWAAPMFIAYVALQIWALRRHRSRPASDPADEDSVDGGADGRSLLADLDGRVPLLALWPLAAIPLVAAPTYALLWELAPPEEAIRAWMFVVIAVQSLIALGVVGYSFVRIVRRPMPAPPSGPGFTASAVSGSSAAPSAPSAGWPPPSGPAAVPPPPASPNAGAPFATGESGW